jgi:tight adherence protein B
VLVVVLLGVFVATVGLCVGAYALVSGPGELGLLDRLHVALRGAWVRQWQRRRQTTLQKQLPEALDVLVRAMRAGYSFQTAMRFVGEELSAPAGPEFMRVYDEQRLGAEVSAALLGLQERSASSDVKMFVTAVVIHRQSGRNLTEVLSSVADVIRQRADVDREVRTLAAQWTVAARLLALFPVLVFGAIVAMDPEFMRSMLDEKVGRFMLAYAAVSVILGYLLLMHIAHMDV